MREALQFDWHIEAEESALRVVESRTSHKDGCL